MKRILLLFVLLALGRMAMSKNPVISYDNPDGAAATYMDLSYRYLRPCSDTVVLVAHVYNRTSPRFTVVWYNGAVGDSIYVSVALNNILPSYTAVLKNPLGTIIDRDTLKVLPQQALNPTLEIHRSAVLNNDTLIAFPQQPASGAEYFYKWYRGIAEIEGGNVPMLINPQPGTYKVYVRNRAACSGVSDTVQFVRTNGWFLDARVSSTSLCGDTVLLSATVVTADSNYTVTWNTGQQSSSLVVTTSGTYTATLRDGQGNVRAVDAVQVVVKPFKARLELHTSGVSDTLMVYPYNYGADTGYYYQWNRNDISFMSGPSSIFINPTSGVYQVYVTNAAGCTVATDTVGYDVDASPLSVDFSYKTTVCDPQTVDFTGIAGTQNAPTYRWNFGDGEELSNSQVSHYYATAGIYNVTLTVTAASGRTGSVSKQLVIQAADTSTWLTNIIQQPGQCGDTAVRLTASANNEKAIYVWNTGARTKSISVNTSGHYAVTVYDSCNTVRGYDSIDVIVGAPCIPADSISMSVISGSKVATGETSLGDSKVKAFPNPSTGLVSLQFTKSLQKPVIVKVYNLNGRVMYNRVISQQLQPLDLSGLPKGYYLIELTGYDEKKVLPLILQ